ncbi:MAG TPA: hypothetical protein PLI79_09055 [Mycobacterium sp.]|nr:hypothetical protein [Mycobacterium sp.]
MGSKSALIKAGIALLVLAPVLWFLLGIADHGGFPHHPVQLLYASVGVRIVTGLIVGTGLILLAVGLVLRFRKPPQPFSTPAIVTADGNPVYPVIGYTPDGQPVTSNQTVGYQAVRPTNTMAIITIIVSLLFSLLAIPLATLLCIRSRGPGSRAKCWR